MRKIPTVKVSKEFQEDLFSFHGVSCKKEIEAVIRKEASAHDRVLVTQEEYNQNTGEVSDTNRCQYITAKIIGIIQDDGKINVVDTFGKHITKLENEKEFDDYSFIELI